MSDVIFLIDPTSDQYRSISVGTSDDRVTPDKAIVQRRRLVVFFLFYSLYNSVGCSSSSIFISPRANNNNTRNTEIAITKAGNQKGNARHAGHLWHKQKNNYLTIC